MSASPLLLPLWGIIGAGVALVVSPTWSLVVLMYLFTQRLFLSPTSGCGLSGVLLATAALVAIGEVFVPMTVSPGWRWLLLVLASVRSAPHGLFTAEERGGAC